MGTTKWLGSLLLLVLLATSQAAFQIPDDKLIVPGQRIGKWTLEMSVGDLVRLNGPGIRILHTAGIAPDADVVRDYLVLEWGPRYAGTFDEKRIEFLGIGFFNHGARLYKTARNIGLQSTRAEVLKAYGKPTAETKPRPGEIRLIYNKIGIAFRFDPSGIPRGIVVFRSGNAKNIWKF